MIDPPAADRVACPECGRNLIPDCQVLPEHTVPGTTETGLSNRRCNGSLTSVRELRILSRGAEALGYRLIPGTPRDGDQR